MKEVKEIKDSLGRLIGKSILRPLQFPCLNRDYPLSRFVAWSSQQEDRVLQRIDVGSSPAQDSIIGKAK